MFLTSTKSFVSILFTFFISVYLVSKADGIFSNPDTILKLYKSETLIWKLLKKYVEENNVKDVILSQFLRDVQTNQILAVLDPGKYLSNPINAFMLVKRLAVDWKAVWQTNYRIFSLVQHLNMLLPNDTDVLSAALNIERLQNTYSLFAVDLIKLTIKDIQYEGIIMRASDTYELGIKLVSGERYGRALEWFQESLMLLKDMELFYKIVIQMLICLKQLGHTERLEEVDTIMKECFKHDLSTDCKEKLYYSKKLFYGLDAKLKAELSDLDIVNHWALCSGVQPKLPQELSKMKCYYTDNGFSFLKVAPFKAEILNLKPIIVQYHDVLSDKEIETLKELALPELTAAGLHVEGKPAYEDSRISKVKWLGDNTHNITKQLNQRIFDMTALNLDSGFSLQINRYGIGGHYLPHYDFFDTAYIPQHGNRIATLMFYMNDVEQGGKTSFSRANIAASPEKGSAVFWYNMFPDGNTDELTVHGACSVLVGEKWVANRWIHTLGNDFCRKSDLLSDDIKFK